MGPAGVGWLPPTPVGLVRARGDCGARADGQTACHVLVPVPCLLVRPEVPICGAVRRLTQVHALLAVALAGACKDCAPCAVPGAWVVSVERTNE